MAVKQGVPQKFLKNRISFRVVGLLAHIRLLEKLVNSNENLKHAALHVPHPQRGYRKRSRNRYGNLMFYQSAISYHDRIHISYLPVSTKLKNGLIRGGIDSQGDLFDYLNHAGLEGFQSFSGIGKKGITEIEECILKSSSKLLPPEWKPLPSSKINRSLKFEVLFNPRDRWNKISGIQDDAKTIMSMLITTLRKAFGKKITIQEELGFVNGGGIIHMEMGLTIPVDPKLDRTPIRKTRLDYSTQIIFERNEIFTLADLELLFSEDQQKTRDQLLDLQGMNEEKVDRILHLVPSKAKTGSRLLALCR